MEDPNHLSPSKLKRCLREVQPGRWPAGKAPPPENLSAQIKADWAAKYTIQMYHLTTDNMAGSDGVSHTDAEMIHEAPPAGQK